MKRDLSRRSLAALGGALLVIATGAAAPRPAAADDRVTIENFAFVPATLTVKPGARVTWVSRDAGTHVVKGTSPAMPFESGRLGNGNNFSAVFGRPGTYEYVCGIHAYMKGTIVVK